MIKANEIKLIPIEQIIPNPKNPNKHPQDQIERLSKIIDFQGFRVPLIISNRSGFLVSGHGRLECAKHLNIKELPVMYQDFESEAQEYAFVVSDNEIQKWASTDLSMVNMEMLDLGPDFDIDLLAIKDFVIEPIEKFEAQSDEDEVPEVKHAITRRGDIWLLGNHRLMCGDSTMIDDVEKLMNGENADFGFCDPPYNLGFKYNSYDDNKSDSEYQEFSKLWFSNLQQFTKRQCVTLGTKNIGVMANLDSFAGVACWVKKNWITSCLIAKLQQWEPIFFYGDYTKHKRTSDLFEINRRGQTDVGGDHTCPKQIDLIDEILVNYCDNSVIDLFGGSGTTMISAEKNGKSSFLLELDPVYADVIVQRWQKYTGKEAVLESTKETYNEIRKRTVQD